MQPFQKYGIINIMTCYGLWQKMPFFWHCCRIFSLYHKCVAHIKTINLMRKLGTQPVVHKFHSTLACFHSIRYVFLFKLWCNDKNTPAESVRAAPNKWNDYDEKKHHIAGLDEGEYQNKSHSPHNNNNAITLMLTFMCNKSHSKLASADVDGKTKTLFQYSCITKVTCLPYLHRLVHTQ